MVFCRPNRIMSQACPRACEEEAQALLKARVAPLMANRAVRFRWSEFGMPVMTTGAEVRAGPRLITESIAT